MTVAYSRRGVVFDDELIDYCVSILCTLVFKDHMFDGLGQSACFPRVMFVGFYIGHV